MEIMQHRPLLEAEDIADWTPLHIASHIGRREVCIRLLQAHANPHRANSSGNSAVQLCMDPVLREIVAAPLGSHSRMKEFSNSIDEDNIGDPLQSEPEWFYVKPKPVIDDVGLSRDRVMALAVSIFNHFPSVGLALLVACGIVDSYTESMKQMIQQSDVSSALAGHFLGESISLSNMMRFGVFDAMPFLHTGVISGLQLAFKGLCVPDDWQKMYRLIQSIALTWWRKHTSFERNIGQKRSDKSEIQKPESFDEEFTGVELRQYLAGSGDLCQLMFSTILLHHFLHGDGSKSAARTMTAEQWFALNRGVEDADPEEAGIPEHVQERVFSAISYTFQPSFVMTRPEARSSDTGSTVLSPSASIEGNVRLSNQGHALLGESGVSRLMGEASQFPMSYADELPHHWSISDVSKDSRSIMPHITQSGGVWMRLCSIFLLFSADREARVPHSMTDVRRLRISQLDEASCTICLTAKVKEDAPPDEKLVSIIRLLSDGRWQTQGLARLEMRFADSTEMSTWVKQLAQYFGS